MRRGQAGGPKLSYRRADEHSTPSLVYYPGGGRRLALTARFSKFCLYVLDHVREFRFAIQGEIGRAQFAISAFPETTTTASGVTPRPSANPRRWLRVLAAAGRLHIALAASLPAATASESVGTPRFFMFG